MSARIVRQDWPSQWPDVFALSNTGPGRGGGGGGDPAAVVVSFNAMRCILESLKSLDRKRMSLHKVRLVEMSRLMLPVVTSLWSLQLMPAMYAQLSPATRTVGSSAEAHALGGHVATVVKIVKILLKCAFGTHSHSHSLSTASGAGAGAGAVLSLGDFLGPIW